jgi:hypothetical protein
MNYLTNLITDLTINKEINNTKINNESIKIINEDYNYQLISLDYKILKEKYNIKNWKKNRPADKFRVDEIYEFYLSNKITLLPGILYVWCYRFFKKT